MTTEEQKNVIGGVVLEYGEVKQKIAALEQELRNKLKAVEGVYDAFRLGERERAGPHLKNWPSGEFFINTLKEIDEHKARKKALEDTMKQYGIDL